MPGADADFLLQVGKDHAIKGLCELLLNRVQLLFLQRRLEGLNEHFPVNSVLKMSLDQLATKLLKFCLRVFLARKVDSVTVAFQNVAGKDGNPVDGGHDLRSGEIRIKRIALFEGRLTDPKVCRRGCRTASRNRQIGPEQCIVGGRDPGWSRTEDRKVLFDRSTFAAGLHNKEHQECNQTTHQARHPAIVQVCARQNSDTSMRRNRKSKRNRGERERPRVPRMRFAETQSYR